MNGIILRRWAAAAACAMLVAGLAQLPSPAATTAKLAFSAPIRLRPWLGGEPSIAFDASGSRVYVTAPQGGPSAGYATDDAVQQGYDAQETANLPNQEAPCPDLSPVCLNGNLTHPFNDPSRNQWRGGTSGVAFWASYDGGKTFPASVAKNIGSGTGGWDSDVAVARDGTVYVADLDVSDTAICISSDYGHTFTATGLPLDTCENAGLNRQGPLADREWLTVGGDGALYLTYHDFASGYPIMLVSRNSGQTFTPCGTIIDPAGVAAENYSPVGGTLVAKPVIAKDGTIYVTVTEPDFDAGPVGAALDHLYVAALRGGACSSTAVFENYEIYSNAGADFALFNSLAIDGSGVLYAVASGNTRAGQRTENTWLWTSRNGGRSWSAPIAVNPPSLKANILPAIAGGVGKNQVAIGWYGTSTSNDPNNEANQWRYYMATSFDAGRTFLRATVTPAVLHYGAICDQGVFCFSGRNLADFSSIAVNPRTGCVIAAIPGDPWNRPDIDPVNRDDQASQTYISRQISGKCLR